MTGFGIVCEFNPLHNGHKRILDEARYLGADFIVCAMSGNAVQRGELAVLDKYTRAEAAVRAGADIVLELPYPYSAAGAEYFATAGVELLAPMCDNIIFGSECGDINYLTDAAETAFGHEFRNEYRERLESGEGAAAAYFEMLDKRGFKNISSNDLLGIEYIRAALNGGHKIKFHTLKREGAAYIQNMLDEQELPSATAIRNAWKKGELDVQKYMPPEVYSVFTAAIEYGGLTDMESLSDAILMYLRLSESTELENIAEAEGGIANRICAMSHESATLSELLSKMKTKRYTDAKLRRALLFCLTGVTREMLSKKPEYTVLLGASPIGREVLSSIRKDSKLNIVTKPADAPRDSEQFKVAEKLESIFTLAGGQSRYTGESYRKKAFIL